MDMVIRHCDHGGSCDCFWGIVDIVNILDVVLIVDIASIVGILNVVKIVDIAHIADACTTCEHRYVHGNAMVCLRKMITQDPRMPDFFGNGFQRGQVQ